MPADLIDRRLASAMNKHRESMGRAILLLVLASGLQNLARAECSFDIQHNILTSDAIFVG